MARAQKSSDGAAPARLQKLLATAGYGSRRGIEEWIRAGRVLLNGRVAQLGDRATLEDEVRLDGRTLRLHPEPQPRTVLLYHKPVGEVTTRRDPQGRPTVFERLPPPPHGRWIVIGRLDVNTSGLLLFTTDGELAHRLMHPSSEFEREYLVRVRGPVAPNTLDALRAGVELDDGPARFERIIATRTEGSHSWYRVVLCEGRNREVRRLWAAADHEVSRLLRVRYGPIDLPRELRAGSWCHADAAQVALLSAGANIRE
jgi:23S rRNA pseudouridine2605 synthase